MKKIKIILGLMVLLIIPLINAEKITYNYEYKITDYGINKTLSLGTQHAYEDKTWKPIAEAKSLLNSSYECFISEDKYMTAKCLDYNLTYRNVEVSLKSYTKTNFNLLNSSKFLTDYPIKIYYKNQTGEYFMKNDIKFNITNSSFKASFNITANTSEVVHFGINSTTVELKDSGSETLRDSFVDSGNVNTVYGENTEQVDVAMSEGGTIYEMVVLWNLSVIPAGQTITNATMYLTVFARSDSGTLNMYDTSNITWQEDSLTWANKPTSNNVLYNSRPALESTGVLDFDSTNWVSAMYGNNSGSPASMWLNFTNQAAFVYNFFRPREYATATDRPALNITYQTANSAPSLASQTTNLTNSSTFLSDTFNVSVSVTDSDAGDKVNITAILFVNTVVNQTAQLLDDYVTTATASYVFNDTNFSKGDNITVQFNGTDGTDASTYVNSTIVTISEALDISFSNFYALNSSGGVVSNLNSSNLDEIETWVINYTIINDGTISDWYWNFTANGTAACSLGNKQATTCYNYSNAAATRWIKFKNETNDDTYDATSSGGNQGDRIILTRTDSGNTINIGLEIDEHYNPNVFKHYGALYNFSNVSWQDGADFRITKNKEICVAFNSGEFVPTDATFYKLDFRANYTTGALEPNQPLEAYGSNKSCDASDTGLLIASKSPSDFQDDGTKFRGIFTDDLINDLGGDFVSVRLRTSLSIPSRYYYIKTYAVQAGSYTPHWNYSTDGGATYNTVTSEFETELNINWDTNGTELTELITLIEFTTDEGLTGNLTNNITWDLGVFSNLPPLLTIVDPDDNKTITFPYNINWTAVDSEGDNLNITITLLQNGVVNKTIISNLNESNSTYSWNDGTIDDGKYNLSISVAENATTDKFSVNSTHSIIIDNTAPTITIPEPSNDTTVDIYTEGLKFYTINYSISDDSSISSCIFYIDGSSENTTTTNITKSSDNNRMGATVFYPKEWALSVSCTDSSGLVGHSGNITFTVNNPTSGGAAGGGGGFFPVFEDAVEEVIEFFTEESESGEQPLGLTRGQFALGTLSLMIIIISILTQTFNMITIIAIIIFLALSTGKLG